MDVEAGMMAEGEGALRRLLADVEVMAAGGISAELTTTAPDGRPIREDGVIRSTPDGWRFFGPGDRVGRKLRVGA